MKIAIVGASKLDENEERDAQQFCGSMMSHWMMDYKDELIIISGGAKGIDSIAQQVAENFQIKVQIFKPEIHKWEDEGGKTGFKTRNIEIAEECDRLYCLPANKRNILCYHCDNAKEFPHEVTGGCWTANKARELGKEVRVMPPVKRS